MIIHGTHDEQIPAFHSQILFETVYLNRQQPSWDIREHRLQNAHGWSKELPAARVQYVELYEGMHNDLHQVTGIWQVVQQFLDTYAASI